jgi:hypothetical protein
MPTETPLPPPNMQIVDLLGNDCWSEVDILARVRAVTNAAVSPERQSELQTIMLGQLAGLRQPSPDELAEIALVQQLTVQGAANAAKARADMALLRQVKRYECAQRRLAMPPIEGDEADAQACAAAQVVVDTASVQVLELAVLRLPVVAPVAMCAMSEAAEQAETPADA